MAGRLAAKVCVVTGTARSMAPATALTVPREGGLAHLMACEAETLMSAAPATAASRIVSRVNPNAVLAVVAFAQFMVVLDATIVNVTLPTIKTDLNFSEQNLPWILNAYTLMFGG